MLKTKRLILLLMVIMLFSVLVGSGCNTLYSATLYDNAISWIKQGFKENNKLTTSQNKELPSERAFIVQDKQTYDNIFVENLTELNVDFSKQMIIVYTFKDNTTRDYFIFDVQLDDKVLTVSVNKEFLEEPAGDAVEAYQRWFVVKMDKEDVETVTFFEKLGMIVDGKVVYLN